VFSEVYFSFLSGGRSGSFDGYAEVDTIPKINKVNDNILYMMYCIQE